MNRSRWVVVAIAILVMLTAGQAEAVTREQFNSAWNTAVFSRDAGWTAEQLVDLFAANGLTLTTDQANQIIDLETAGDLDGSYVYGWSVFQSQVAEFVASPSSAQGSVRSRVVRTMIVPGVQPRDALDTGEARQGVATSHAFSTDVFGNRWEWDDSNQKGMTYGVHPMVVFGGEVSEFGVGIPILVSVPEDGDNLYSGGLDAQWKLNLGDLFSIGLHGVGLYYYNSAEDLSDGTYSYSGGPFASLNLPLGDDWQLTLGGLYDYYTPEEGDSIQLVAGGANLGWRIGQNLAVNGFGIYYMNLEDDVTDDAYTDVGGDIQLSMGTWIVRGGGKVTVGLDEYSSQEIYLGSEWRF